MYFQQTTQKLLKKNLTNETDEGKMPFPENKKMKRNRIQLVYIIKD